MYLAAKLAGIARLAAGLSLGILAATPAAWAQTPAKPALAPARDTAAVVPPLPVTQRTAGGVRYVVHGPGTGPLALPGRRVAVRYTGFLPNGRVFDATMAHGNAFRFRVGRHEAIAGWDELLPLLSAGARVRAWIPAALAYGAKGVRNPDDDSQFLIPPDTELIFELHVISVR